MSFENGSNFSRRELLRIGLLAGISAIAAKPVGASPRVLPLIYKAIPSTGEKVPVIGLGCDQLGVLDDYNVLRGIVKRMHELGGTVIDSAHRYGNTEIQIGKALVELGLSRTMFIDTKFNAPGVGDARDAPGGQQSIELSIQRLPKVDLMFIHLINSVEPMMPLLQELKKQGRVRYIGITNLGRRQIGRLAGYLRKYPLDFVQVAYCIEDRAVEEQILPLAQERKIAVMAAHPLGRNSLLQKVAGHELPSWAADFDIATWAQFLLKYAVSHPAITCVIPGTTKIEHLEDNQAAGRGRLPDAATRKKMEEFWGGKA